MKVAFLVLNHRDPGQLARLVTTLRSQLPDSPIVVHHDIHHGEFSSELFKSIGDVHLLTSGKRMAWGDYGITEVCCWALAWMRENLEFDWMVLLSAQDYPIKPLVGLQDDLAQGGADAVFAATPIDKQSAGRRILMRRRYFFQYRTTTRISSNRREGWTHRLFSRAIWSSAQMMNLLQPAFKLYPMPDGNPYRVGWRSYNSPFGRNYPCWQGSQWFALSWRALTYALDYISDHPEMANYYRHTMVPDESMLATIVCNGPNLRVAHRNVTYTRWVNDMSPHPQVFTGDDLNELVGAPQYFARKFDINQDSDILDQLDRAIGAAHQVTHGELFISI